MKLVSLFAGIGGFELAAEAVGWTPAVSCEMNPFGRHTLGHYWPKAYHHDDIHTLTGETVIREITKRFGYYDNNEIIVTGGFPCQPYSTAGKRRGNKDSRHLWPEMLRIIAELKPRHVVGENVPGIISWDGGLVFEQVCADLENEGYEVQPCVLPACGIGAPHGRARVWFVAHTNYDGPHGPQNGQGLGKGDGSHAEGQDKALQPAGCTRKDAPAASHPLGQRLRGKGHGIGETGFLGETCKVNDWRNFPTQSPVCGGDDGFPARMAGGTLPGMKRELTPAQAMAWHRKEAIMRYGNAIVPQVALQVFRGIIKANARYGAATPDLPFGT